MSAQAQIGFLIGMVVTFGLALWLFFSAHKMREAAEQQRRKISEDVRHIFDLQQHERDMVHGTLRSETRLDMRQAVKDVIENMGVEIAYEVEGVQIPDKLIIDAHFESRDYGDEQITITFISTGPQWEGLKQHLEEFNGRNNKKEKVSPKARNRKGS